MIKAIKEYTLSECMERMAEYASAYERTGGENVIFCEDRLTLIAERALLKVVGGSFRTQITTFARFLQSDERIVSKQGSVMLVGEVMTALQRENKLQCFTSLASIGKNARCVYETLAQFGASLISPELLKESIEKLPEDNLKRKISDLAIIYEGYLASLLSRDRLDESRYLTLLPKRILEEGSLKGKNVFFLGYDSFTAQAQEIIRAALSTAQNVLGIFCADDKELYASRAFQTFCKVCKDWDKTVIADMGTPLEGEAEILRGCLFNPEYPKTKHATEKIRIFEGEDKTAEAEYVATKIRRAMAENSARWYRDIAVLVPSVSEYALPLKKAFSEYGIPYFVDEKKSMKQHPLSKFLLACFRVIKEGYSPASVQALTQNYFFGDSDEYRNYLYKFANYRGGAKKPIKSGEAVEKLFTLEKLEDARARLLLATEAIKGKSSAREYCDAVRGILKNFAIEKQLEKLRLEVEDVAQQGYLSQIYKATDAVLEEAEGLMREKEMTAAEFAAVLEDGFDAMEISLIPLKADAVFVGDITESRIEKVNILFAMGMTDAVPLAAGDTAIVSDREIARLAAVQAYLEPTVAEVNLRSRERAALNLCTFTDRLYLSYPLPADGSEPTVSEVFRYVDGSFCEATGGKLLRRKKTEPQDFAYKCSSPVPAIRQMLTEKAAYLSGADNSISACSTVYEALRRLNVGGLDGYFMGEEALHYIQKGEELFFHDGRISPTSLEGYFTCPFGHYASRGLRLKEREEAVVLAVDSGNFIHLLLEKTAPKAKEIQTEAELRKYAYEVGEELMKSSVYLLQQDTRAGAYSSKKLLEEGVEVAAAAYRQIKNSEFNVEKTEAEVQGELIFGKVDRIDGNEKYVRIVDYKTGEIDESPSSYYTGQKLQMQLYMSEIKGERIPAGVFYFPASVSYGDETERFRMKGFLNGDEEALRAGDKDIKEGEKSEYFSASLKGNARLSKVMDEDTFSDFLAYGDLVAKQGAKELKEGYIAPTPYDGGCKFCKFGGMCGFNREVGEPRKEGKIEPSAIAQIVRDLKEGE